ncbi:uncharacterized protein BX664DRAFT_255575 [Halteromyces radiatus]|uniref:uncharacterized protein n=1 Tax=Halteromyces radiatus TaxID=101107 RepID=UPI00222096D0|nr:uncharacterized protein BX664DRAFT_255575 [Halteromyces radiatus]KAI8099170.1 hypothetical protein BX664DRAFT_255575 [Halteromyces radiatus]
MFENIHEVRKAMDLFLNSYTEECDALLLPKRDASMYHSLGYAFILSLKAVLTYQRADIESALDAMKHAYQVADKFRKRDSSWKNAAHSLMTTYSVQELKEMTTIQRHAELVFAETYLMKAGLQIVYEESFVAFLREGVKVHASHQIYKALERYLMHVQEEASQGKDVSGYGMDAHFASGIAFGMGCFNLAISMLPDIVLKMAEFVGFHGDRGLSMWYYQSIGGWDKVAMMTKKQEKQPQTELQGPHEGLRRQFCDMMLILYNIVLAKLTPVSHVNEPLSDLILQYNLKLYPRGMVFLTLNGRRLATQRQLQEAKVYYQRAIDAQDYMKQLHHISFWELGFIALLEQDWKTAHQLFQRLNKESNWSKAVYTYLQGLSLYLYATYDMSPGEKRKQLILKSAELMALVTKSKQKIAGKSIFIEKFVARKSRKFDLQGNRLLFPDLEIIHAFSGLDLLTIPLMRKNLHRINAMLKRLANSHSFYVYDDLCLCHFLRTNLIRLLLEDQEQKEKQQALDLKDGDYIIQQQDGFTLAEMKEMHKESVHTVMTLAEKIQLDHWLYYFTVYEQARMMIMEADYDQAKKKIQYLIDRSERHDFNVGAGQRAKNKYSMENALILKCHNCLGVIDELSSK